MTHSNIYTKFLIEYDKANITSSYPSLTEYEIATILDKAYNAIITQKIVGNNTRRSGFEDDIKAIEDIRPLIKTKVLGYSQHSDIISNEYIYKIPADDYAYYVSGQVSISKNITSIDNRKHLVQPVILLSHEDATKFMATSTNMPWMNLPVIYIDGNLIHMLVDPYEPIGSMELNLTYIKKFNKFALDGTAVDFGNTEFELSDAVAEEVISLAVLMSAETVQSPRLTTKLNTRPLES